MTKNEPHLAASAPLPGYALSGAGYALSGKARVNAGSEINRHYVNRIFNCIFNGAGQDRQVWEALACR